MTIASRVTALAEQLSGREADRTSRLFDDLDLDSLDRIQLAIDIERTFDIVIPDADVDDECLGVLGGLIAYVERKVSEKPQSVLERALVADRPGAEL